MLLKYPKALTADGVASLISDVTSAVTEINATAGTGAVSLPDGANGQIKTFLNTSTAGTNAVTITPANLRGGADYHFGC